MPRPNKKTKIAAFLSIYFYFAFTLFIASLNIGCKQSKPTDQRLEYTSKDRTNLKNAAFCRCVYKSLPDSINIVLNEGSLGGYVQIGNHGIEAYEQVFVLADQYSKKEYLSKSQSNLVFMKCLDFYNSVDLNNLVDSLAK